MRVMLSLSNFPSLNLFRLQFQNKLNLYVFQLDRLERLRLVLFWHFCDKSDDSQAFCNEIYYNDDGTTRRKPKRIKKNKTKKEDIAENKAEISSTQELFANPDKELAKLVFDKCCEYIVVSGLNFKDLDGIFHLSSEKGLSF